MIKCPNCGSTAQVKVIEVEFEDDPFDVIRYKTYKCGCGRIFFTRTYYKASTNEIIDDTEL
jgi:transposase-like protein